MGTIPSNCNCYYYTQNRCEHSSYDPGNFQTKAWRLNPWASQDPSTLENCTKRETDWENHSKVKNCGTVETKLIKNNNPNANYLNKLTLDPI